MNKIGFLVINRKFIPIDNSSKCINALLSSLSKSPKIKSAYTTFDLDDNLIRKLYVIDGKYYTLDEVDEYYNRPENEGKTYARISVNLLSKDAKPALENIKKAQQQYFPEAHTQIITSRINCKTFIPKEIQKTGLGEILGNDYFITISGRSKPKTEAFSDAKKYYALSKKLQNLGVPITPMLAYILNQIIELNQKSQKCIVINIGNQELKLSSNALNNFKRKNNIDGDFDINSSLTLDTFDHEDRFNNITILEPKKELIEKKMLDKLFIADEKTSGDGVILNIVSGKLEKSLSFLVSSFLSGLAEDNKESTIIIHSGDDYRADIGLAVNQKKIGYNSIGIFNLTNIIDSEQAEQFAKVKQLYSENKQQEIKEFIEKYELASDKLTKDKDNLYDARNKLGKEKITPYIPENERQKFLHLVFAYSNNSNDDLKTIESYLTQCETEAAQDFIRIIQEIEENRSITNDANFYKKTFIQSIENADSIGMPLFVVSNMNYFAQAYRLGLEAVNQHNNL